MTFIIASLGLAFGSFNTVLISRLPKNLSILGRSTCTKCAHVIPFSLNIPILSYILLRGKCKYCGAKISLLYPLTELATLISVLLIASQFESIIGISIGFIFASFSVALVIIDWREHRLPNLITYSLFILLLSLTFAESIINSLFLKQVLISSAVMVFFYFALNLITRGGMGMGDVKYAASIGLVVGHFGYLYVYLANFAAFFLGSIYGISLIAFRKGGRKSKVAFGPFLYLGALIAICSTQFLPLNLG